MALHPLGKYLSALSSPYSQARNLVMQHADWIHRAQDGSCSHALRCAAAGAVFIQAIQTQLDKFGDIKFESLSGASARKIVLVIGIMSAHALGEGCGVGVSFCGTRGWAQVAHVA